MSITFKLMELERQLEIAQSPVLRFFADGIEQKDIVSLFEKESLVPTEGLVELYQWKNGVKFEGVPTGNLCFGVNGVFFPLEESLSIYRYSRQENLRDYFPIFSDDSFLIQLNKQSPDFGKIFIYSPAMQILKPQSYFDSLASMIETLITCFKEKAFFYDTELFLEQDYDRSFDIAKQINPNSAYWS